MRSSEPGQRALVASVAPRGPGALSLGRWAAYIFVGVIVLYTWAAWYNVWGCELYYPRLLEWLDLLRG